MAQKKAQSASPWPSANHKKPGKPAECWGLRTAKAYGEAGRLHPSLFTPYTALASIPGQSHSLVCLSFWAEAGRTAGSRAGPAQPLAFQNLRTDAGLPGSTWVGWDWLIWFKAHCRAPKPRYPQVPGRKHTCKKLPGWYCTELESGGLPSFNLWFPDRIEHSITRRGSFSEKLGIQISVFALVLIFCCRAK